MLAYSITPQTLAKETGRRNSGMSRGGGMGGSQAFCVEAAYQSYSVANITAVSLECINWCSHKWYCVFALEVEGEASNIC